MDWKNKANVWVEEIEIAAEGVSDRVKELVQEGNVRRLIIRKANDDLLLEIPLTAGVAAGALMTYMLPILTALITLTGLFTRVKIQVIRNEDSN